MELLYGTPPPTHPITLGAHAWAVLEDYLSPHVWSQVWDLVAAQPPDPYGRITLELSEHLYVLVSAAVDAAQFDHVEGDN